MLIEKIYVALTLLVFGKISLIVILSEVKNHS